MHFIVYLYKMAHIGAYIACDFFLLFVLPTKLWEWWKDR